MIGALLAEVHLRHGRPDAARDVLDQMISMTQSMPTHLYEPELRRVEAEWMRLDGREDDARRLLLRAISTAREQSSWALAIRSGLALARPLSSSYKADLRLLADLYEHLLQKTTQSTGARRKPSSAKTLRRQRPSVLSGDEFVAAKQKVVDRL
jgi:ATP/maltotriose-dependent transcriptional regulator MalT